MANPFKCGFVDKMESPLRLELRDPIAMHLRARCNPNPSSPNSPKLFAHAISHQPAAIHGVFINKHI